MEREIIRVKIGEVKVGHRTQLLKTTLGSCIGISIYDTVKKKCALAHCLLPESDENLGIGARYVNQAIESLFALMKVRDRDQKEFIISYAGGANMMSQIQLESSNKIGNKNLDAIRSILKKYKFKVRELDCGDTFGRQMSIDCTDGKVIVSRLLNG
ncbi:chemotaxis protein CheD [Halobacteriovorax sp.]|uniref:chemotaxis protein CheD n=1 Tax=Halobacteriovorax sp. TaxID=2020862 RepID=UPI003564789E